MDIQKILTDAEYTLYKELEAKGHVTFKDGSFYFAGLSDPYGDTPKSIYDLVRFLYGNIITKSVSKSYQHKFDSQKIKIKLLEKELYGTD